MDSIAPQPDCSLSGRFVRIDRLRFADLPEMAAWQPHTNPLLQSHNVRCDSPTSWRNWLRRRLQTRWVYAIRNVERELVGHLSLRQINYPHSARLGITIAAERVGRGYGQDAMCLFLDYYFGQLGFEEMRLDVSGANLRARHLYQKLGFRQVYTFWLSASPGAVERLGGQEGTAQHFRKGKERYYEMRLRASQWWPVRASLE
jgi:RimJ/RimL family protein N-acetyltransferase